jgi:hypothetical protein
MDQNIYVWESEGGSADAFEDADVKMTGVRTVEMTGTPNQIEWAKQIRIQVDAEFTRVRIALEKVAARQSIPDQIGTQQIIAILEDKRDEVMRHTRAGYFIHSWQEPRDRVRLMILGDSRYLAIRAGK